MPYRRRTTGKKRTAKKKVSFRSKSVKYRKRRYKRKSNAVIIRNSQLPFPKKVFAKLESTIEGVIPTNTSMPYESVVGGNYIINPYTPLFAGGWTGTYQNLAQLTPVGVHQYLTEDVKQSNVAYGMYNNYKVHGVSTQLEITPEPQYGGTGTQNMQLFNISTVPIKAQNINGGLVYENGLNIAPITGAYVPSMPFSKTIQINPFQNKTNILSKYWSIRSLWGLSKQQWKNVDTMSSIDYSTSTDLPTFVGSKDSDPTNVVQIYYHIRPSDKSQGSNNAPIPYKLKNRWYVEFFNPSTSQQPLS